MEMTMLQEGSMDEGGNSHHQKRPPQQKSVINSSTTHLHLESIEKPRSGSVSSLIRTQQRRRSSTSEVKSPSSNTGERIVKLFSQSPNSSGWKEISRWIKYQQDYEQNGRVGAAFVSPLSYGVVGGVIGGVVEGLTILDTNSTDPAEIFKTVVESLLSKGLIKGSVDDLFRRFNFDRITDVPVVGGGGTGGVRRNSFKTRTSSSEDTPNPPPQQEKKTLRKLTRQSSAFISRAILSHVESISTQNASSSSSSQGLTRKRGGSFKDRKVSSSTTSDYHVIDLKTAMNNERPSCLVLVTDAGICVDPRGALVLVRCGVTTTTTLFVAGECCEPTLLLIYLPPPTSSEEFTIEVGKTLGTMLSNKKFHRTLTQTTPTSSPHQITTALQTFLSETLLFDCNNFSSCNLLQLLPLHVVRNKVEIVNNLRGSCNEVEEDSVIQEEEEEEISEEKVEEKIVVNLLDFGLAAKEPHLNKPHLPGPDEHIGRPFAGAINDIKRALPLYKNDFLTGLSWHVFNTTIFLYFATLAPNVTFGGILRPKTNELIGVSECLLGAGVSGIIFSLLSAAPFTVVAPTGPLLIFDEQLFQFTQTHNLPFLTTRAWVGIWAFVITLIVVMLEGSVVVKHITRFTREIFSGLSSLIFVYESFSMLYFIYREHPWGSEDSRSVNGTTTDDVKRHGEPNTALLSIFLMLGMFTCCYQLDQLKMTNLFPKRLRSTLVSFRVPIALVSVTCLSSLMAGGVYIPRPKMPYGLHPTNEAEREWFISPFDSRYFNHWLPLITILPGGLVFLLVFITVVICEKIFLEYDGLRKVVGLHWDAMVFALTNLLCGLFGWPWMSTAILRTLAHINALTIYEEETPPGTLPKVVGIRENRLSSLGMSCLLILSLFLQPVLKLIPMPVFFGIFLYMGVVSFGRTQLYQRILLLVTPAEAYPVSEYARRVPVWRITLFTLIQLCCLAFLWVVKSIKEIALLFPLVLILLVPLRKCLRCIYNEDELNALDGDAPLGGTIIAAAVAANVVGTAAAARVQVL